MSRRPSSRELNIVKASRDLVKKRGLKILLLFNLSFKTSRLNVNSNPKNVNLMVELEENSQDHQSQLRTTQRARNTYKKCH